LRWPFYVLNLKEKIYASIFETFNRCSKGDNFYVLTFENRKKTLSRTGREQKATSKSRRLKPYI
jgi:hypothetical protein